MADNTKLLRAPEDKLEKVFYYLFNNGEQAIDKILKASDISSKASFYVLKSRARDKLVVTRKAGATSFYNISEEKRKEIQFKINQKLESLKRKEAEEEEKQTESERQNEILNNCKKFFSINLKKIKEWSDGNAVNINFNDLVEYSIDFGEFLLNRPEEFIQLLETALEDMKIFNSMRVRIKNIPKDSILSIENIRSKHLGKFICIDGRVASASAVDSIVTNAKFECPSCGTIISILQMEKKFKEPSRCSCGRRGNFKEISKDLVDGQSLVIEDIQELTDNPHTQRMPVFAKEDLVDENNVKKLYPGNEVRIIGVLKEIPVTSGSGTMLTRFTKAIEVNSVELLETEIKIDSFTEKELEKIKEMADEIDENGMGKITQSFAPDICGYEQIKKAIMLQACNERNNPKDSDVRNKMNILLIGDVATSKSFLCKFAVKITPGSRKAVGAGASAVGITAAVIKEDSSVGGYRLEAGALPLAREILFIDEMNNLSDEEKPKLQEAMSEQSITINKANLHATLRVTAGVLAAANPAAGNFIDNISITKQFNIPPAILNRFDVIFAIRDIPNKQKDEDVVDIMFKRVRGEIEYYYSVDEMKKFFTYIRAIKKPKLPKNLLDKIKKIYSGERSQIIKNLVINARFIEALTRMVEASAKMRLSEIVEEKDLELAIEILSESHFKIQEYKNFKFNEDFVK